MLKIKKVLTILLAVLFVATMTIGAASAGDNHDVDHEHHEEHHEEYHGEHHGEHHVHHHHEWRNNHWEDWDEDCWC